MELTVTQVIIAALTLIITIAISAFGGFFVATMSFRSQIEQLSKQMTAVITVIGEKLEPRLEHNSEGIAQLEKEIDTLQTNLTQLSADFDTLRRKNDIAHETQTYIDLRLEEARKESFEIMKSIIDKFFVTSTDNQSAR